MRVLVFIGLKIAEIVGVVFVPYWVGLLVDPIWKKLPAYTDGFWGIWFNGFMTITVPIGVVLLLSMFIFGNWKWAGKITRED